MARSRIAKYKLQALQNDTTLPYQQALRVNEIVTKVRYGRASKQEEQELNNLYSQNFHKEELRMQVRRQRYAVKKHERDIHQILRTLSNPTVRFALKPTAENNLAEQLYENTNMSNREARMSEKQLAVTLKRYKITRMSRNTFHKKIFLASESIVERYVDSITRLMEQGLRWDQISGRTEMLHSDFIRGYRDLTGESEQQAQDFWEDLVANEVNKRSMSVTRVIQTRQFLNGKLKN